MPSEGQEITLWEGQSSQWSHLVLHFLSEILLIVILVAVCVPISISAVAVLVPLMIGIICWLVTRSTSYELTSQRLKIDSGILKRRHDELELYRVTDHAIDRPFFLRIVGLGSITMVTSDATTPTVTIKAIPDVMEVREKLRVAVQTERDRERVRELDVDGGP